VGKHHSDRSFFNKSESFLAIGYYFSILTKIQAIAINFSGQQAQLVGVSQENF
jgi:hypothetical protein